MLDAIIARIKEEIVSSLQYGLPVASTVTWKDGNTLIADVDAITDFELRVNGDEPPVHTVEQGLPPSPIKPKPRKNIRSYNRRTKKGVQRVKGYQTQPKKLDRKEALEESVAWTVDLTMRDEADQETDEAIEQGIDNAISSFG